YARKGCLRDNLNTLANINWKDKLNLLQCIALDLQIIHSQELIHRDLHSGNILLNSFKSAYIADLGLSITANIELKSKSYEICGILPYIAPEVLSEQQYIIKSDIYSFGIIMWEILYGRPVPNGMISEIQFQLEVCDGLRPPIDESIAMSYSDLMKKCWHAEPEERPTAEEIYDFFAEWQVNENILSELSEFDKNLQNIKNDDMQVFNYSHYKSSFILSNSGRKYRGNYKFNFLINYIIL
ncbi:kinase-like domain-containing protein, partial [Gigaspora rosea]